MGFKLLSALLLVTIVVGCRNTNSMTGIWYIKSTSPALFDTTVNGVDLKDALSLAMHKQLMPAVININEKELSLQNEAGEDLKKVNYRILSEGKFIIDNDTATFIEDKGKAQLIIKNMTYFLERNR